MNDTPETDTAIKILRVDHYEYGSAWMDSDGAKNASADEQYVAADFARKLERKLNHAIALLQKLKTDRSLHLDFSDDEYRGDTLSEIAEFLKEMKDYQP